MKVTIDRKPFHFVEDVNETIRLLKKKRLSYSDLEALAGLKRTFTQCIELSVHFNHEETAIIEHTLATTGIFFHTPEDELSRAWRFAHCAFGYAHPYRPLVKYTDLLKEPVQLLPCGTDSLDYGELESAIRDAAHKAKEDLKVWKEVYYIKPRTKHEFEV